MAHPATAADRHSSRTSTERHLRNRLLRFALPLVALSSACHRSPEPVQYSAPPDSAVARFRAFADSVVPAVVAAIRPLGYHPGESDSGGSADSLFEAYVHQVTAPEASAQLYDASISVPLHTHWREASDWEAPVNLSLEFGGNGRTWVLLTSDGYLYSLGLDDTSRSDLPLDVQSAIRQVFSKHAAWSAWFDYKRTHTTPTTSGGGIGFDSTVGSHSGPPPN